MIKSIGLGMLSMLSMTSCKKDDTNYTWQQPQPYHYTLYHLPNSGWVGDVMPYYKDGKFHIYYLNDATNWEKQSSAGEHPIYALSTSNLLDVSDDGTVIPYGNKNTQDHLIGTGSMVQASGKYYFYYTGHNGNSSWLKTNSPDWFNTNPREAIMVASSTDGKQWTKLDKPILEAPADFERNDFRDPYVFYNEEFNTYWMLVSGQQNGNGVLLLYTSSNLETQQWALSGTLDVEGSFLMMECADIFKIGNLYYMLFAEDWSSDKGTHYRVATSTRGPWLKPNAKDDRFDGHQFYAGKTASNGSARYAFAWAHRRSPETDQGALTWAGNLITHEVYAVSNGILGVRPPQDFLAAVATVVSPKVIQNAGTVSGSTDNMTINGGTSESAVTLDSIRGCQYINFDATWLGNSGQLVFGFGNGSYRIVLDKSSGRVSGILNGNEVTHVYYDLGNKNKINAKLLIDGSIVVLYLDDQVALTNRTYSVQNHVWSITAQQAEVVVSNLKIFKK